MINLGENVCLIFCSTGGFSKCKSMLLDEYGLGMGMEMDGEGIKAQERQGWVALSVEMIILTQRYQKSFRYPH